MTPKTKCKKCGSRQWRRTAKGYLCKVCMNEVMDWADELKDITDNGTNTTEIEEIKNISYKESIGE
jgi:hypothetical protein